MFNDSQFDGDISGWDVSSVKDMWSMFKGSKRKIGNIDDWIISEGMLKDSCHPNPNYNSGGVRLWKLANL